MLIDRSQDLPDPQGPATPKSNGWAVWGGGWLPKGYLEECQVSHLHPAPHNSITCPPSFSHVPLVPTWILALSLSLAGALLLLAGLVAIAVMVRKVKVKNLQKKRQRESCWVQVNFATTDMTFDNSLFAISMKMNPEEDATTLDACSGSTETPGSSGPRKRPTSTSSSPEPPEFSTFRACQ